MSNSASTSDYGIDGRKMVSNHAFPDTMQQSKSEGDAEIRGRHARYKGQGYRAQLPDNTSGAQSHDSFYRG